MAWVFIVARKEIKSSEFTKITVERAKARPTGADMIDPVHNAAVDEPGQTRLFPESQRFILNVSVPHTTSLRSQN